MSDELVTLIKAQYPLIYVVTPEEERAEQWIVQSAQESRVAPRVFTWTVTHGLLEYGHPRNHSQHHNTVSPETALDWVIRHKEPGVFIFKDLHPFTDSPAELDDAELRENVENEQAALFLPYPREEADLDFQKLGLSRGDDDQEQIEVLLAATRKETTDSYIEMAQKAGLTPRSVEISSFALLRTLREQLRQTFTDREAAAVVDIGYDNTEISIVVDGIPHFARDVPIGVMEMQNAVSRAASMPVSRNPNWAQTMTVPEEGDATAPTNRPGVALIRVLQELGDELRRSIDFYRDQPDSVEVVQILLAGPGAGMGGLDEYMSNRLGIAASCVDPVRSLNLELSQDIPQEQRSGLGVVLGLALREA